MAPDTATHHSKTELAVCRAASQLFGVSVEDALGRGGNLHERLISTGLLSPAQADEVLAAAFASIGNGARLAVLGHSRKAPEPAPERGLDTELAGLRELTARIRRLVATGAPLPAFPHHELPAPSPTSSPPTATPISPSPAGSAPPQPVGDETICDPPTTADQTRGGPATDTDQTICDANVVSETDQTICDPHMAPEAVPDDDQTIFCPSEPPSAPPIAADVSAATIVGSKDTLLPIAQAEERLIESALVAWLEAKGLSAEDLDAARTTGGNFLEALVLVNKLTRPEAMDLNERAARVACPGCDAAYTVPDLLVDMARRVACPRCGAGVGGDNTVVGHTGALGGLNTIVYSGDPASDTDLPAYAGGDADSNTDLPVYAKAVPATRPSQSRATHGGSMDNYEIIKELARGGMGIVYKARQKGLRRLVCLKVMLGNHMASDDARRRFLREAEASARLHHPGIVPVYEVGEHNGKCFFSMEFIDGKELGHFAQQDEPSVRDLVEIMVKVCDAIHYAHQHGIIHRDLKPANVMIDENKNPHVMDFGIAKQAETGDGTLTREGEIMGTPHYMPPEQAEGKVSEIDVRSDVYSLGVILYELLTGQRPFRSDNLIQLIRMVVNAEPTTLRLIRPDLDPDLETLVLKAMEKEMIRRYQSAEALRDELQRWLAGEPIHARRATVAYRVRKWASRNRREAMTAATGLLSVFLILSLWTGSRVREYLQHEREVTRIMDSANAQLAGRRYEEAFNDYGQALMLEPDLLEAKANRVKSGLLLAADAVEARNPAQAEMVLKQLRYLGIRGDDVRDALKQAVAEQQRLADLGVERQRRFVEATRRILSALGELDTAPAPAKSQGYIFDLVRHQDDKTVRILRQTVSDVEAADHVRTIAAEALGWMRDPSAVRALIPLLEQSQALAEAAAKALGSIGGEQALRALLLARERRGPEFRDQTLDALQRLAGGLDSLAAEAVVLPPGATDAEREAAEQEAEIRTLFLRADLFRQANDHEAALQTYDRALERLPQAIEGYLGRSLVLLSLGRLAGAESDLDRVVAAKGSTLSAALLNRAEVRRRRGNSADALADLAKLLRFDPANADGHLARGRILLNQGELDQALADLERAVELRKDHGEAVASRAEAYLALGRLDAALVDATQALDLEPGRAEVLVIHGRVLLAQGELRLAAREGARAMRANPNLETAPLLVARARSRLGRTDDALATLQKGFVRTQSQRLRLERVLVLLEADRLQDSLREVGALLADGETLNETLRHDALALRGVALMGLKRAEEALPDLARAARAFPDSVGAQYNLACALAQTGALAKAERALKTAVSLGYSRDSLREDEDLQPLHGREAFERLAGDTNGEGR